MKDEMKESQHLQETDDKRSRCQSWVQFFDLADRIGVPGDFLSNRSDDTPQPCKVF